MSDAILYNVFHAVGQHTSQLRKKPRPPTGCGGTKKAWHGTCQDVDHIHLIQLMTYELHHDVLERTGLVGLALYRSEIVHKMLLSHNQEQKPSSSCGPSLICLFTISLAKADPV